MKLRKIKKCWEGSFNSESKNTGFSTSTSETGENKLLFVLFSYFVSFGVCICVQYFFGVVRNQTSNKSCLL